MNCYDGGMHGYRFSDKPWIMEQLDLLPIRLQTYTKDRYSEIYTELLVSDKNNSRYRANSWLRATVKKHGVISNKNEAAF